jgi:hypothetical protein
VKKKTKTKKKQDMPEFEFKQFTPEEDRIYTEAVTRYREAITGGKTLKQAYGGHAIADKELEALIQADFLKILIAERHFAGNQSLEQIAHDLDVPTDLVRDTHARMLQEVGATAASRFGQEFGGIEPKTND